MAILDPTWKNAIDEEVEALLFKGAWSVVTLPPRVCLVACKTGVYYDTEAK